MVRYSTLFTRTVLVLAAAALLGSGMAEARGKPAGKRSKAPAVEHQADGPKVNLNTATPEQLALLPGIGPSKARAIVRYRERVKFRTPVQLIRVRGIGRKTYQKLRPYLSVSGPTTATSKISSRRRADSSEQ